jgi:cytochrome oxidase assembly protein ShyY1
MPTTFPSFRFRWIPFIAAVLVAAIGFELGQWQMRRAHEKEAIEHALEERGSAAPVTVPTTREAAEAVEFRHVLARGEFVRDWPVYLDNRPLHGAAGFYVLMPMRLAGSGMHVLVARGWVPRDMNDRTRIPAYSTPSGELSIEGIARRHPDHLMQLGEMPPLKPGAIVQNLDPEQFAAASRLDTQPFIIEQTSDTHDGLIRDWPRASLGIDKHRGYAFQWYGLAATAILFFVVTGFRRGRN